MWLLGRTSNVITDSSREPKHTMGRLLLNLSAKDKEPNTWLGFQSGTKEAEIITFTLFYGQFTGESPAVEMTMIDLSESEAYFSTLMEQLQKTNEALSDH